jgi:hypothetical protein
MLPRLKELTTFIQGSEIEPLQSLTGNTPCAREIRLRSKNSQLKLVTPRKFCLPQIIRLLRELELSVKPRQSGDEMWGGDKRLKVPNFQSRDAGRPWVGIRFIRNPVPIRPKIGTTSNSSLLVVTSWERGFSGCEHRRKV